MRHHHTQIKKSNPLFSSFSTTQKRQSGFQCLQYFAKRGNPVFNSFSVPSVLFDRRERHDPSPAKFSYFLFLFFSIFFVVLFHLKSILDQLKIVFIKKSHSNSYFCVYTIQDNTRLALNYFVYIFLNKMKRKLHCFLCFTFY